MPPFDWTTLHGLDYVESENLQELGTTDSYHEAGFLAPTGHYLDLSGKRVGEPAGRRHLPHEEAGGTAGVQQLMGAGHIRLTPEWHGAHMLTRPTEHQYARLREITGHSQGAMTLDLHDGLGDFDDQAFVYNDSPRRWSGQYPKGTRFERIQHDIDTFYRGKEPSRPPIARYTNRSQTLDQLAREIVRNRPEYYSSAAGGLITNFRGVPVVPEPQAVAKAKP
jgi:hypothetical protein